MLDSRKHHLLFALGAAFALSGCATGTNNLDDYGKYHELRPGVSTKKDVYERFGQPGDVLYHGMAPSAPSAWIYYGVFSVPSAMVLIPIAGMFAQGETRETTIAKFYFDSDARFANFETSNSSRYHNNWASIVRDAYRASKDTKTAHAKQEMERLGKPFDKNLAAELAAIPPSDADTTEAVLANMSTSAKQVPRSMPEMRESMLELRAEHPSMPGAKSTVVDATRETQPSPSRQRHKPQSAQKQRAPSSIIEYVY